MPAARIDLYVQPGAARTEVAGMHDRRIKIRLAAPPVEGAANEALIEFVAGALRIAKTRVRIVRGASTRRKVVEVDGVDAATLARALSTRPAG